MTSPERKGRKVALVTPYYRPVVGGITSFVDGLAQGLEELGVSVRIWTRFGDPSSKVERGPEDPVRFVHWARRRIQSWEPDVVHAHSHWYTLASAFRVGRPIASMTVFTVHTDFRPRAGRMRSYLLSRLLAKADIVTAVSPASVERLRTTFPNIGRIERMAPGVTPFHVDEKRVSEIVALHGLAASYPKLCTVGMMVWSDKVRGMQVIVRSVPLILRRFPSAKLIFVGGGAQLDELKECARAARVEHAVVFAGVQTDPGSFISASDIVLHCSFQDAFPQALLEALAMGKPVIANSEVAANMSYSPDKMGIVSVSATPDGIAEGVLRIGSDNALREELGRRGRKVVSEEFTWGQTALRFLRLYGLA